MKIKKLFSKFLCYIEIHDWIKYFEEEDYGRSIAYYSVCDRCGLTLRDAVR